MPATYGKYYRRDSDKPAPSVHMTEDQWESEKAKPYESRDTNAFRCKCGCPFFHEVFKIDRDGIRINKIQKGEFMFACCKCATIYGIDTKPGPVRDMIFKLHEPGA